MGNNERFSSINELYKRVLPALQAKSEELKREKIIVDNLDIWNYCMDNVWKNKNDLRIYELVDDILKSSGLDVINYARKIKN